MYDTIRKTQTPALLKALRYSYGIATTQAQAAHAHALAWSVREIRPYIFKVGGCQVSLWRMACTCKAHRTRALKGLEFKPCVHFLLQPHAEHHHARAGSDRHLLPRGPARLLPARPYRL